MTLFSPLSPFHFTGPSPAGSGSILPLRLQTNFPLYHCSRPSLPAWPLLVLSLPFVALLLANQLFALPQGWRSLARRIGDARPWAVVLITYAILRNLPWEPFSWLAPGG